MKKIGPRACVMCGPTIQGCHVCSATLGHRHLVVVDRHGEQVGSVAACDAHSPPSGVLVAPPAQRPAPAGTSLVKRTRDRAYRLATSIVRERHYDEFADLYAQVLAGEVEGRDAA